MTAEISSMSRIDQLADEYAQRALDSAIVDPINQERSAKATPEEIEDCHNRFREREKRSAVKLLTYAETRDYVNLCNALGKHNPAWRKLFCRYAGIDSLPKTDRDISAFLRTWIGEDETHRQQEEIRAKREREEQERNRVNTEKRRAECLNQSYRFALNGGLVKATTFGGILDQIAPHNPSWTMSKRGAFPTIRLFYFDDRFLEFRKAEEIAVIRERFPERVAS